MKMADWVSYTSKAGKTANYRVIGESDKTGTRRLHLESTGEKPIDFWVAAANTQPAQFDCTRKPTDVVQVCWECGCEFTWKECKRDGGNWSDNYCGC